MMELEQQLERVETAVWASSVAPPHYQQVVRRKTIGEVAAELNEILGEFPYDCEGFDVAVLVSGDEEWPEGEIVVFSVNGSSEGDWVHVQVAEPREHGRSHWETQRYLLSAKTFAGRDSAWAFARRLADLLGA